MTDLNSIVPGDLGLTVTGLPASTCISLDSSERRGDLLLLDVTLERDDPSVGVNDVASLDLRAGDTVLITFNVPLVRVGHDD